MTRLISATVLGVAVAMLGCGATTGPGDVLGKADAPDCDPDEHSGQTCPVNDRPCQERIWRAVRCVQPGLAGPAPRFQLSTNASGDVEVRSPARGMRVELDLLGIPQRPRSAASYSDGQVVVLDRSSADPASERAAWWMFAVGHELGHVAQGQLRPAALYVDLNNRPELALVEGEAQLYALLTVRQLGFDFDIEHYLERGHAAVFDQIAEDFGLATALFPYYIGQRVVYEAYRGGGWPALDGLSGSLTTYALLFGEPRPTTAEGELVCSFDHEQYWLDDVPARWRVELDAWDLLGLLQAAGAADPLSLARAWRGGQAVARVYIPDEQEFIWGQGMTPPSTYTLRWRSRWSDAAAAQQVASLLGAHFEGNPRRVVERIGTTDVLVGATDHEPSWDPDPIPLYCP